MLWLVRHAAVEVKLDRPATEWLLTPDGVRAAQELADRLPQAPRVRSSPEPKAVATAEPIAARNGVRVELDDRLGEVARASNLPDYEAHTAAVRRYLAGEPVDGWEPRDLAGARIQAAVSELDDCVVVSHATILSLLLGYSFEEWRAIELPDVIQWQP